MSTTTWTFEPGHTEAGFRARHMMVTYVTGLFKDVHGSVEIDFDDPTNSSFEVTIDTTNLWTGESARDEHLRAPDFFDVENHPTMTFKSTSLEQFSETDFAAHGDLTIKGITKPVSLDVRFLGRWETPWWEGNEDKGPKTRLGIQARGRVNRHDWGVSWQSALDKGGVVVGDNIDLIINAELIRSD